MKLTYTEPYLFKNKENDQAKTLVTSLDNVLKGVFTLIDVETFELTNTGSSLKATKAFEISDKIKLASFLIRKVTQTARKQDQGIDTKYDDLFIPDVSFTRTEIIDAAARFDELSKIGSILFKNSHALTEEEVKIKKNFYKKQFKKPS